MTYIGRDKILQIYEKQIHPLEFCVLLFYPNRLFGRLASAEEGQETLELGQAVTKRLPNQDLR
jgi:hypothetical protein